MGFFPNFIFVEFRTRFVRLSKSFSKLDEAFRSLSKLIEACRSFSKLFEDCRSLSKIVDDCRRLSKIVEIRQKYNLTKVHIDLLKYIINFFLIPITMM